MLPLVTRTMRNLLTWGELTDLASTDLANGETNLLQRYLGVAALRVCFRDTTELTRKI